jgi:endonuclease G
MDARDRVRQSRLELAIDAAKRWQTHSAPRAQSLEAVRREGPGAGDSIYRQVRHSTRKAIIVEASKRMAALPIALERKMGPTWDVYHDAPNEAARLAGRPVARIVSSCDPAVLAYGFGTGFMVGRQLLLTNNHVFPTSQLARGAGANFLYEAVANGVQRGSTFEPDPDTFFLTDRDLDYTLIAVKDKAVTGERLDDLGMIAMIEATAKILRGQPINIIQYANGEPKGFAYQENKLLDILDEGYLHYQTDTDTGSSGSPVFSGDWELVGLHHASVPRMENGLIMTENDGPWEDGMPDSAIHWIANEGIRISAIVRSLSAVKMGNPKQAQLLAALLSDTGDPVDDLASVLMGQEAAATAAQAPSLTFPSMDTAGSKAMPIIQATFTGPVTIHIGTEAAATLAAVAPAARPAAAVAVVEEAVIRFDPDYDNRQGYDPAFLGYGLEVPPPSVTDERLAQMYRQGGEVVVLRYHHFSLAMNADRRLMMWSAANVDYDEALRDDRDRKAWGTDKWIGDPRIPAQFQLADPDIYEPAKQIDRGHIVRREDNAWGDGDVSVEYANSDTFHWTNCTPQHTAFNKKSPGKDKYPGVSGLWGGFEDHVKKNLKKGDETKACIFAGPVLARNDRLSEEYRSGKVKYPICYWKVVFVAEPDGNGEATLRAYGFVMSQADVVSRFGIEFDVGQFQRYQRPLAEISQITGVVFDEVLLAADTMG